MQWPMRPHSSLKQHCEHGKNVKKHIYLSGNSAHDCQNTFSFRGLQPLTPQPESLPSGPIISSCCHTCHAPLSCFWICQYKSLQNYCAKCLYMYLCIVSIFLNFDSMISCFLHKYFTSNCFYLNVATVYVLGNNSTMCPFAIVKYVWE